MALVLVLDTAVNQWFSMGAGFASQARGHSALSTDIAGCLIWGAATSVYQVEAWDAAEHHPMARTDSPCTPEGTNLAQNVSSAQCEKHWCKESCSFRLHGSSSNNCFFFLSYVHLLIPYLFNPITGKLKYFSLLWVKNDVTFDVKCCQSLLFANLKAQLCFLKILSVCSHSQPL